jgi:hypothetical protein
MAIAAFFRTEVVFTRSYGFYDGGYYKEHWCNFAYTKCNVQPWKEGEKITNTEGGVLFSDYQILYIKNVPTLTPPTIPPGTSEVTIGELMVWLEGDWYIVRGNQNWRRAGRAPKHRKLQISRLPNQTPADKIPPTPDTSLRSVEAMDNETYELEQAVITLEQRIK